MKIVSFKTFIAASIILNLALPLKEVWAIEGGSDLTSSTSQSKENDSEKHTKDSLTKSPSSKKIKNFYVSSREPYLNDDQNNLCHLVAKILDEPENKKFSEIGFTGEEFVIPKEYSDFTLPNWQDVPREDLKKYVKSEKWLKAIAKYESKHPSPSEKLLIQKTKLDLDEDGKDEEVLRFGRYVKLPFDKPKYNWTPFASDTHSNFVTEGYNKRGLLGYSYFIFKFKNKIYQTGGYTSMAIYMPTFATRGTFVKYPMCHISLTTIAEKNRKRFEEECSSSKN